MAKLYLGLDCSTQSFTALLLEQARDNDPASTRILLERSLNFDQHFPEFGTTNGTLPGENGVVHSPPQLWVRALEETLALLKTQSVPLGQIAAIGFSGQQHASVYLNGSAEKTLASLRADQGLAPQLENLYSRKTSPIWMDSSTSAECAEITTALGGPDAVCALTGSRAFERFTGPQIRKFYKSEPAAYEATAHICLVSSFIPSVLAGKIVPVDPGDGAGMNLMDIAKRAWAPAALEATAPNLASKLLPILESDKVAAKISSYFVERFGFSPDCQILPGTGDNPASLVGLGLVSGGALGISLGTSDTVFAYMDKVSTDPTGASHVFGSPTGGYMAISVYKNGSLAREAVRQKHGLSWDQFSGILRRTPPGNNGRIMLPYFGTEIVPHVQVPGPQRYGFEDWDAEVEVRAVVEAQMTSMAVHAEWMGEKPVRIQATGGASDNREILQIMADVFGVPVLRQETSNSAGLGAAIRAQHAALREAGVAASFEQLTIPFVRATYTLQPDLNNAATYAAFARAYKQYEEAYLKTLAP
ncbi:MAG: putative xylulose kinase [Fibrobacteria bacterium]|jgi:xylulokinase|nr:putative xylulose kinase [Fibrobacteria bacterium]